MPWLQYQASQAQYQADKAEFLTHKESLARMEAQQAEQEGPLRERQALEKKRAGEYRRLLETALRRQGTTETATNALANTVSP